MTGIDVALVLLLLCCAIRGLWRGFLRESFGFAGLVLALFAALKFSDDAAGLVTARVGMPETAALGLAFVATFLVVHALLTVAGLLADRLIRSPLTRTVNGIGGGLFGLAKGAAVLAFALLFLRLFPVVAGFDERIIESRIGNPMASAAATALRFGREPSSRAQGEA